MPHDLEIQRSLGRIEGKLDQLMYESNTMKAEMARTSARVSVVENILHRWQGMVAVIAAVVASGVTIVYRTLFGN